MAHGNGEGGGPQTPLSELLRLQAEFQMRITDESLRYLRGLQGVFAPYPPGTVLQAVDEEFGLVATGAPGATVDLVVEVENRQRVHSVVSAALTPLTGPDTTTWFPATESSPRPTVLAPEARSVLRIQLPLPAELPPGTFRGLVVLQGVGEGGIPLTVNVTQKKTEENATEEKATP
ncbi:hypothetical protein [Streptomyces sp. NPDC051001]|uniref:hypothetical protein n=1 Tax=Streptomyces sp. NPDC051001 TaxID=3155795 RepID=UPI003419D5A0